MRPSSTSHCTDVGVLSLLQAIPCRYWIILLCGFGLMISYADRSNMAVAIVAIAREYGYTKPQQGLILAAFFLGYISTPILGGTLADRYGGKSVLAIGGLIWTVFTILTPLASSAGVFWIVAARIGLGLGEGVAYPSVHAMIGTWIPPNERSKAVATVTAFAYLGSVIALPTSSALVVSSWGWRSIFWLFGILGSVWNVAWQIWGASEPSSCRWISEHEKHWIYQQQQLDRRRDVIRDNGALLERINSRNTLDQENDSPQHIQAALAALRGTFIAYHSLSPTIDDSNLDDTTTLCVSEESDGLNDHLKVQTISFSPGLSPSRTTATESLSLTACSSRWEIFRNKIRSKRRDGVKVARSTPVPWKELIMRREVWAIIFSQLFNSFGFFIMQSWLPTFYLDYYGVDVGKIGYFAVVPSAVQGTMGLVAGYLGDKAAQDWHWATLTVRRAGQTVGSLGLGVFLLIAVGFAHTATLAMALITIGMALNGFTMIGASAYQHDFCPEYAGFIFSLGNTAGSIPALFGVFLVGVLLDNGGGNSGTNPWALVWTIVCLFYITGTILFILLSTHKKFSLNAITTLAGQ